MRGRARPLFIKTVFQILFRVSQSNGKNENPKTDISALKSVFGFRVRLEIRNPDFENHSKSGFPNRTHPLSFRKVTLGKIYCYRVCTINRPFPSSPDLCFKTRVGAHPLIWKSFFIFMQIKLIFTRKVVHPASF